MSIVMWQFRIVQSLRTRIECQRPVDGTQWFLMLTINYIGPCMVGGCVWTTKFAVVICKNITLNVLIKF